MAAGVDLQNLIGVDCKSLKSFIQSDIVFKKFALALWITKHHL